jgi:hypothetical protein
VGSSRITRPDLVLYFDAQNARRLQMPLARYQSRGAVLARASLPVKLTPHAAGELHRRFVEDGTLPALSSRYQNLYAKLDAGEKANFDEMRERVVARWWAQAVSLP